jgi:hypothetical protein
VARAARHARASISRRLEDAFGDTGAVHPDPVALRTCSSSL